MEEERKPQTNILAEIFSTAPEQDEVRQEEAEGVDVAKEQEQPKIIEKLKKTKQAKEQPVVEEVAEEPEEEDEEEEKSETSSSSELEKLKKTIQDTKSWGQKKSQDAAKKARAYAYAKQKVTDLFSKLHEEGMVFDEHLTEASAIFNEDMAVETETNPNTTPEAEDPYLQLKNKLDDEFKTYKKYSKVKDIEQKYQIFFDTLHNWTPKAREEILAYINTAKPEESIEDIISMGEQAYKAYVNSAPFDGLFGYIDNLEEEKTKLEVKIKELEQTVDTNNQRIYTKSSNSSSRPHQEIAKPINTEDYFKSIWRPSKAV